MGQGQTSFPPNTILVMSAGLIGATAAGGCVTLTAAQGRTLLSVYSTAEVDALISGSGAVWGDITGTLSDQTDLQAALDAKQSLDATLTALAGVTTAADKVIYATGSDTFSTTTLTTFGRSLIDDADASTARTTLGLGTMATQASTSYAALSGATFTGQVQLTGSVSNIILSSGGNSILLTRDSFNYISASDGSGTLVLGAGAAAAQGMRIGSGRIEVLLPQVYSAASSTGTFREQAQFAASWVSNTDASRKAQVIETVYDTAARSVARSFANGTNGYKAFKVLTTAPADADLAVSEVVLHADSAGGLAYKLKDSGGTVRSNTIGDLTITGLVSIGPYTFATLPSASANSGKCLRITDRGQKHAYSDGTNWLFIHDNSVVV